RLLETGEREPGLFSLAGFALRCRQPDGQLDSPQHGVVSAVCGEHAGGQARLLRSQLALIPDAAGRSRAIASSPRELARSVVGDRLLWRNLAPLRHHIEQLFGTVLIDPLVRAAAGPSLLWVGVILAALSSVSNRFSDP